MKSTTLSAIAEPNRLQIVELLRSGPLTVGEIAKRLELSQPQTSKHLRILNEAGLVEVQAVANRRIYKLWYTAFQELDAWLDKFRHVWDEKFDLLDDYLQELQRKEVYREDHQ
jgi:DNA-binding transcriptional ArsR family regulator